MLERHQERKLNSFDCVNNVEVQDGELFITLEPAYSWYTDCFLHTRKFKNFNDALAALRKFK